jgi:hypothetical protein
MAMWLRQSTASQEILLGRFVDSTDGNTEETGLTIANTDIKLWVEGATTLASKNSGGATHIANGNYYCVLDATDTATLGKLEVHVHVSGALAVKREFMVVPAMVYDSLVLGTDRLDTNTSHWNDLATVALPLVPTTAGRTLDVSAGGEAGVDWANVGSPTTSLALTGTTIATTQKVDVETIKTNPVVNGGTATFPTNATLASTTNITAGTVTTATNVTTVNGLGAGVITATSIASDAITAAKIADGAIDAATFAAGAINAAAIATDAIDADALAADAITEIWAKTMTELSAVPGVTASVLSALTWVFEVSRNKITQTATTQLVKKDDGTTTLATSTVSDDGTTFTRGVFS